MIVGVGMGSLKRNYSASFSNVTKQKSHIPTITKKEKTNSLPSHIISKIKEIAKEDASKGVYMGKKYISSINAYKRDHISPDRKKLISLLSPQILNGNYVNGKPFYFKLLRTPFTGKMWVGATGSSLLLYNQNGEEILTYSTEAGWAERQTSTERAFYDETTAIYYAAYKEAREELKTNTNTKLATSPAHSSFDASV